MTTRRTLLGITTGVAVALTLTQGGQTASATVPSWGQPPGGTISIVTDRSTLAVAPDSVRMWVDLSGAAFDTPAPANAQSYDRQFHELHVVWDFGDPGTFAAPVNLPAAWKNRNFGHGLWAAHCYTQPGTYTINVTVIEPSSGKMASATTTVTVGNADAAYPGTQTICVNPVGDSDFTGAPAGAQQLNLAELRHTSQAWIDNRSVRRRWLFKRGGTFTMGLEINSLSAGNLMFGAYGTGARPIINFVTDRSVYSGNRIIYLLNHNLNDWSDFRFVGLDFRGNYDPKLGDNSTSPQGTAVSDAVLYFNAGRDLLVSDCRVAGAGGSNVYLGHGGTQYRSNFHLHDTYVTDFGGQFTTFYSQSAHALSSCTYTGVAIVQNVDAVSGTGNFRASLRLQHVQNGHIRGCDFFHRDPSQPILKLQETPLQDGGRVHVHTCALEGNLELIAVNRNASESPTGASMLNNVRIERNILVSGYRTQAAFKIRGGGVTIENNLIIQPATVTRTNQLAFVVSYEDHGTPQPNVFSAPQRVLNNTFVNLRTSAQNSGTTPVFAGGPDFAAFTDKRIDNNIIHQPNFAGQFPHAPLQSSAPLWEARNKGYRDEITLAWDAPGTETPAGSVRYWWPAAGSPALDAATAGGIAYLDLHGAIRSSPADMGAIEVA